MRAREDCRMCHSPLRRMLRLAATPIANSFPDKPYQGEKYPLDLMQCIRCQHVQLHHVPAAGELYGDYRYSTPDAVVPHLTDYAKALRERYPAARSVLEIGCNNGIFLDVLTKHGFKTFGVDPAATHEKSIRDYFNHALGVRLGQFDLIVANNVFAHIDDLASVFAGIDACLSDDGALVFEVQDAHAMFERGLFDMVYHEHHDYHTLAPWVPFLRRYGMVIAKWEKPQVHGGSLRVYCERPGIAWPLPDETLDWRAFNRRIEEGRRRTMAHLASGNRIVLFGAPAKATTLIHHYGIASRFAYCVDDTPAKQGRYIPGTGIQIRPTEALKDEPPDLLFLAAWNFHDVIKAKYPQYRIAHPFLQPEMAKAA